MFGLFESQEQKLENARFQRIMNEQPSEKYRGPSPLGDNKYAEENFIDFYVIQNKIKIKLNTYRQQEVEDKQVKGLIFIFHGLNSHINNTAHIAKAFSQKGYCVIGFDHRGFGKSEGIRGYMEQRDIHIQDCLEFIEQVKGIYQQGLPVFQLGQSLGGQTSFLLGLKYPNMFTGIILLAPAIMDNNHYAKIGKIFAKMIGSVFPTCQTIATNPVNSGNKNPFVHEQMLKDPLVYRGKVIPGTIKNLLNNSDYCVQNFQNFNVPFLAIQGEIDKLVHPDGSKILIERSPVKDKQLLFYDNLWHNIYGEPEIFEIIPKILKWVDDRIQQNIQ